MQIRCPHCHSAIEVVSTAELTDVTCPTCGSAFDLLPETAAYFLNRQSIGHFELLAEVGTGGFGTVWKARDTKLDRFVAIKVPRLDHADKEHAELFLREARAAAQLRHPHIIAVHEVGRVDGQLYIVSDFVQGITLADRLTAGPFAPRDAAELIATVAEALHHAHEAGVIHRDLKPQNIMLERVGAAKSRQDVGGNLPPSADNLLATAQYSPRLMDFGLAKREAGEITMTLEGKVLGTPAYMSPEQARGDAHRVDRRADLYSLGVIFFELLTGERPFRGNQRMLLHQVIHDEPPSPRKFVGTVPRDLETICLKAMAKEPSRRFETAQELADDLRRFLRGEPIRARRVGGPERLLRWCRRNPTITALSATLAAAATVALVVTTTLYLRAADFAKKYRLENDASTKLLDKLDRQVDEFFVAVTESPELLGGAPGTQDLRARMLAKAQSYYEQALASRSLRDLDDDVGRMNLRLAIILRDLGDHNGAREAFGKSRDAYRQLLAADASNRKYLHGLALGEMQHGLGLADVGKTKDAIAEYELALPLFRQLLQRDSADWESKEGLAMTLGNLAAARLREKQYDAVGQPLQEAIELWRQLIRENPSSHSARLGLAVDCNNLGSLKRTQRNKSDAKAAYQEAYNLYDALCRESAIPNAMLGLAHACIHLVQVDGDNPRAPDLCRRAIEVQSLLVTTHPQAHRFRTELAWTQVEVGKFQKRIGKHGEAEKNLQAAIQWLEGVHAARKKAAAGPTSPPSGLDLASSMLLMDAYRVQGENQRDQGRPADSLAAFEKASRVPERILPEEDSPERLKSKALTLAMVGSASNLLQDFSRAEQELSTAIKILEALRDHRQINVDGELPVAYSHLGVAYKNQRRWEDAQEMYRKAIAIYIKPSTPDNPDNQIQLGGCTTNLGNVDFDRQQFADALALYRQAEIILRHALAVSPNDFLGKQFLYNTLSMKAQSAGRIATQNLELQQFPEAVAAANEVTTAVRELDGTQSGTVSLLQSLAAPLAHRLEEHEELDAAIEMLKAVEVVMEQVQKKGPGPPGNAVFRGGNLVNLAMVYFKKRDIDSMRPTVDQAVPILEAAARIPKPDSHARPFLHNARVAKAACRLGKARQPKEHEIALSADVYAAVSQELTTARDELRVVLAEVPDHHAARQCLRDVESLIAFAANSRAWLLATAPEARSRNGIQAVALASKACELTNWKDWGYLDTLAAAHAEEKRFKDAGKWQEAAISLAPTGMQRELQDRLQLYRNETAYRAPLPTDDRSADENKSMPHPNDRN